MKDRRPQMKSETVYILLYIYKDFNSLTSVIKVGPEQGYSRLTELCRFAKNTN